MLMVTIITSNVIAKYNNKGEQKMSLMWQEINEQPIALEKSKNINVEIILNIVRMIQNKDIKVVFIAARGSSDNAGVFSKYIIEYLTGIPVVLSAPSIMTIYHKKVNFSDSLIIGISQSGEALDVLEVIKEANKQDAVTIGITNFENSKVAEASKFHLFLNTGVEKSVAATKTFTAQLYLMAWLVAEWTKNDRLKKELEIVPDKMDWLLNSENGIEKCAYNYKTMENCFVLSRGINYSIAMETALKIQETSNVYAIAHATSDFYHGPIAMINEYDPIILFAPDGPCFEDIAKMGRKLKKRKTPVISISNRMEASEFSDCILKIPSVTNDIISSFYNITVAQLFACQLSLSKGLNPDLPKGLKKVTITK